MIRKHTLYLGLMGTVLSGCGSQYMHYGYDELISLGEFRAFVEHTRKYTPCKWESRGQVGSRVQYDYGCHGGAWNTSTLLVNQTQRDVDQIRLLWRERPTSPTYKEDARIAHEFLLSALRYATPEAVGDIQEEFFKRTNKQIVYGPLNIVLTSDAQDRGEWLHRLVITDTRAHHERPQYQRPAKMPSKKPLGVYQRADDIKHDPYAEPTKVPMAQPTTPEIAPETAEAINEIRRPVMPHDITDARNMVRGVEKRTESVAEQILQVREELPQEKSVEPQVIQPAPKAVIVEPVEETIILPEEVNVAPVVKHPVRELPAETGNREDRLRNILLHAADTADKAAEAEKTKEPVNYIYDEEAYLKDIEDEVYRQMKGQYEGTKSKSNGWDDLKGIREGLEIMEFNMSDEGGL